MWGIAHRSFTNDAVSVDVLLFDEVRDYFEEKHDEKEWQT